MLEHNLLRRGEPEAGPMRFRCEKGLEQFRLDPLGNADSGIPNPDDEKSVDHICLNLN